VLALLACALGHACGHAVSRKRADLAPAGSARDDGSGVLARLSAGDALDRPARSTGKRLAAASTAHGSRTGGTTYGGSRYANYRFDRSAKPFSSPAPYAGRYLPVEPSLRGSIEGTVLWPTPPRALERLGRPSSALDRRAACPDGVANPTLALVTGGAVANAVVYLEDIASGRGQLGRIQSSLGHPAKHLQTGGVVEWRGCRFHPQVQVAAPIGAILFMSSADEAVQLSATRVDGRAREPLWSVPLGAPGAAHEHLLDRAGFLELRAERPGHAATAWVVVASHPYFAVTDERGHFSLDEVPPGSYTLVAWHAPVVVGMTPDGETVTQVAPLVRRRVVVKARQAQHLTLRLPTAH
jgi:hypothetical protein